MAITVYMDKLQGERIVESETREYPTRTAFEAVLEAINDNEETECDEYTARDEWMEVSALLVTGKRGWWGYEVHMRTHDGEETRFTL